MLDMESPTTMVCVDLAIGWQTGFDLSIETAPIAEASDSARTWNGKHVDLADPAFRLLSVTIQSGGEDHLTPAFSQMWPGTEFDLVPPDRILSDAIAVGGTTRTLSRTPYPDALRVIDTYSNPVDFAVDGATITLASPAATPVRIYYQPQLRVFLKSWSTTHQERKAMASWTLTAEEVGGTS